MTAMMALSVGCNAVAYLFVGALAITHDRDCGLLAVGFLGASIAAFVACCCLEWSCYLAKKAAQQQDHPVEHW